MLRKKKDTIRVEYPENSIEHTVNVNDVESIVGVDPRRYTVDNGHRELLSFTYTDFKLSSHFCYNKEHVTSLDEPVSVIWCTAAQLLRGK